MKRNVKKLSALALALTLVLSITACSGNGDTPDGTHSPSGGSASYTVTARYTPDDKDKIPEDMVNQVMFANSEANVTVESVLTLDSSAMSYTLFKTIQDPNPEADGEYSFKGEWEFTGSYTANSGDENSVVLKIPTSGKNNI